MRIGIIESGLPPERIGGAELQAWELAWRLSKRHEVTVFTRSLDGRLSNECRGTVPIVHIPIADFPFRFLSHIMRFSQAIVAHKDNLDVLICYRTLPNGLAASIARKKGGPPFITSIRGGDWYFHNKLLWDRLLIQNVFNSSDGVVVQTEKIAGDVKTSYPSVDPLIIPNGITSDDRIAYGKSVIFVGNLIPRKGVNILVEACRDLKDVNLVICGSGSEEKMLKKISKGMNIRFLGKTDPDKVRDIMVSEGIILVLPSVKGEGLPNVLLEAMSVGLPIIASNIAGIADVLENGRAGIIVKAGDVNGLREAISFLINKEDARKLFTKRGKSFVKQYAWDKVILQWERELERIIYR